MAAHESGVLYAGRVDDGNAQAEVRECGGQCPVGCRNFQEILSARREYFGPRTVSPGELNTSASNPTLAIS